MRSRQTTLALTLALAALLAAGAGPASAQPPGCLGDLNADLVEEQPADHEIRFGINARSVTGQIALGAAPAVPEDPERHVAKLGELQPEGAPFVLRLTRFFWRDREQGFRQFLEMTDHYTRHGFQVELQVRYQPDEQQEGDIAAWVEHVREIVRRFGPNPGVVGLQITNEVNITFSPDSSDGAYDGARQALVSGVVAAKREAERLGHEQLRIGFNWAYRLDPVTETSFWNGLRDRGGQEFVDSLDFIGLDAYPGTIFPPAHTDFDGYRDGMVNAMSALRCYATIPDIPESVPMEIGENGWPTFLVRSYADQARILEVMVQAAHDFRGTYNVHDYRWFNLRDSDTGHPGIFQNSGLLEDDYTEKPAFAVYRGMVDRLALREAEATPPAAPAERDPRRRGPRRGDDGERTPRDDAQRQDRDPARPLGQATGKRPGGHAGAVAGATVGFDGVATPSVRGRRATGGALAFTGHPLGILALLGGSALAAGAAGRLIGRRRF